MPTSVQKSDRPDAALLGGQPCAACRDGNHSQHQPRFGGICIGCTCAYRPGAVSDPTPPEEIGGCSCGAKFYSHEEMTEHECPEPRPELLTVSDENALIDRMAESLRFYGCDDHDGRPGEHDEVVEFLERGYRGAGWYVWCGEYPEEGCSYLAAPHEYSAVLIAQLIVELEREALAETIHPSGEELRVQSPAVAFQAKLMGLGNAEAFTDLADLGEQPVLLFYADPEEVRKAGPLLRRLVSLTAIEVGP